MAEITIQTVERETMDPRGPDQLRAWANDGDPDVPCLEVETEDDLIRIDVRTQAEARSLLSAATKLLILTAVNRTACEETWADQTTRLLEDAGLKADEVIAAMRAKTSHEERKAKWLEIAHEAEKSYSDYQPLPVECGACGERHHGKGAGPDCSETEADRHLAIPVPRDPPIGGHTLTENHPRRRSMRGGL